MRRLAGFVVLAAGLAFAVFAYYPSHQGKEIFLAELTHIAAAPPGSFDAEHSAEAENAPRNFSPRFALEPTDRARAVAAAAPASPGQTGASTAWQTVVIADPAAVPAGARLTSSKPGDSDARYELVLSIQRELKRMGCYGGALNGSWNGSTKRAMGAFMQSVNANLPADEPDYILQTLLKGHTLQVCATDCPKGQTATSSGKCIPAVQIAQQQPPKREPVAVRAETAPALAAAPAPSKTAAAFTTTVAVAETAGANISASAIPVPGVVAALPGRMSIGASSGQPDRAEGDWRITLVPSQTPQAAAQQTPTAAATIKQPPRRMAALPAAGVSADLPDDSSLDVPPLPDQALTLQEGLPGSKAGRTDRRLRTAALAPGLPPPALAPPRPRRVATPGRAKPSAGREAPRRRVAYHTRSVRAIFSNPFGIR